MDRQTWMPVTDERLSREHRVLITNAIRDRIIELYNRRYMVIHGAGLKALKLAADAVFNEFVDGTLLQL